MTIRSFGKPLPFSLALPLSLALIIGLAACTGENGASLGAASASPTATATLMAADGTQKGTAKLVETPEGLHVWISVTGLPEGLHGAHVHMIGACTAPDFASAGGHWNPTMRQHGMENPQGTHMGDMPNLTVGPDGAGKLDYVIKGGLLAAGANPLLDADGAAVVIHAKPDDMKSDPAGNAGGRVACGVLAKI